MRISLLVLALAATTSFALPLTHDERSDSSVQPIALLRARRLGKFDSFGKGGSGGSKGSGLLSGAMSMLPIGMLLGGGGGGGSSSDDDTPPPPPQAVSPAFAPGAFPAASMGY